MAQHKLRRYCGRCHLTIAFQDNDKVGKKLDALKKRKEIPARARKLPPPKKGTRLSAIKAESKEEEKSEKVENPKTGKPTAEGAKKK